MFDITGEETLMIYYADNPPQTENPPVQNNMSYNNDSHNSNANVSPQPQNSENDVLSNPDLPVEEQADNPPVPDLNDNNQNSSVPENNNFDNNANNEGDIVIDFPSDEF